VLLGNEMGGSVAPRGRGAERTRGRGAEGPKVLRAEGKRFGKGLRVWPNQWFRTGRDTKVEMESSSCLFT